MEPGHRTIEQGHRMAYEGLVVALWYEEGRGPGARLPVVRFLFPSHTLHFDIYSSLGFLPFSCPVSHRLLQRINTNISCLIIFPWLADASYVRDVTTPQVTTDPAYEFTHYRSWVCAAMNTNPPKAHAHFPAMIRLRGHHETVELPRPTAVPQPCFTFLYRLERRACAYTRLP